MKAFFDKFPMEFNDQTAIKMIHKKIECGQEKNKNKDPEYMKDLAVAYDMLCLFFDEHNINPDSILK